MASVFSFLMLESELPALDILLEYGSDADIVLNALRYTTNPALVQTRILVATKRSVLEGHSLSDVKEAHTVIILGHSE